MRYALKDGLTMIVGAADTLVEFDELINQVDVNINAPEKTGIVAAEVPSVLELMMEEKYEGFKRSPLIITHKTEESLGEFNERYGIICIKRNALLQKHENMLDDAVSETDTEDGAAALTIEEMYGLDASDPWDQRSEEDIEKDAQMKKLYDAAKKNGELSDDSFAPVKKKKNKSGVYVTDIHTHTDSDGEVIVDKALVVQRDGTKKKQVIFEEIHDDDDTIEIDTCGPIAIYYRMDILNVKMSAIIPILEENESSFVISKNISKGCWFAFITQHQAERAGAAIEAAGYTIEVYAVNDAGERLIPKGVQGVELVDPNAAIDDVELPRPWNDRSKEISVMTKAEKLENWKTVHPNEFFITGVYTIATGTVVHITPKSYFNKKNRFWGKSLNIDHLLPDDLKEVSPGTYVSKSRDWNHVSYAMARLGYSENMMLQVYLNNL